MDLLKKKMEIKTDKNKEVFKKYAELWNKIKILVEKINDKPEKYKYEKDYMKIKNIKN